MTEVRACPPLEGSEGGVLRRLRFEPEEGQEFYRNDLNR